MDETTPDTAAPLIRNRTFDEIAIGDSATIERSLTAEDVQLLATLYGDGDPQQLDPTCAASPGFHGVIGHGMWGTALISAVLGTRLPGAGTVYLEQTLHFHAPVRIGDTLAVQVQAIARDAATRRIRFACRCTNQHGVLAIDGAADVIAPGERIEYARTRLPEVRVPGVDAFRWRPAPCRWARSASRWCIPCDATSLAAALDARAGRPDRAGAGGTAGETRGGGAKAGLDLAGIAIEDVPHSHAAAARAVELAAARPRSRR